MADWYDPHAALIRKYHLLYYPGDNTCEMIDEKTKRLFLKRSKCESIGLGDLHIGSVVTINARQLMLTEFGDEYTRRNLRDERELTLAVVKPDGMAKFPEMLVTILEGGFSLANAKTVKLSKKEAREFYIEHKQKPFFDDLTQLMAEGPILAMELVGSDAVRRWREAIGSTDPVAARASNPLSLRARYGTNITRNACHGSDSLSSAEREIKYLFGGSVGVTTATFTNNTLGIIKPRAVRDGLVGKILMDIVESGLEITALATFNLEKANAEEFYEVYRGVVHEYRDMVQELCSGMCVAMEISGEDSHERFRKLAGPMDPEIARHLRPSTLRAKYGIDKVQNGIHCTDLADDAPLEVEYFFKILLQ